MRGGDLDLGEIGSMWRRRDRNRRRQEKILGQFSPGERGSAWRRREKNGGRRMNFLRSVSADEFFAPGVGGRRCKRSSGGFFFALGSRELGFSETVGPNGLFFRTYKN